MLQELRFACCALLQSRGYAGATLVTLALGLGVNIAVATVAWRRGSSSSASARPIG